MTAEEFSSQRSQTNLEGREITGEPTFTQISLYYELLKSDLLPENIKLLQTHSKGVFSIYDFARLWQTTAHQEKTYTGYALGLTHLKEMYYVACQFFNLMAWDEGYRQHDVQPVSGVPFDQIYLKKIVSTNDPIIFFAPREVFSHDQSDVTAREMKWFLSNLEEGVAQNVYFVFGLYYLIAEEIYRSTLPAYSVFRFNQLLKLFDQLYTRHDHEESWHQPLA